MPNIEKKGSDEAGAPTVAEESTIGGGVYGHV